MHKKEYSHTVERSGFQLCLKHHRVYELYRLPENVNKAKETKQQDPRVFCDCIWNNNQARFLPIKVYDAASKCFYRQHASA